MGRMLGSYASEELDRPDLNKCPDCGCFFAHDTCPLCGKVCPEHMRAGNRRAVKQKKKRSGGSSGRVTFVEWYHQWWFILLALIFVSPVGIILFATSPYKKSVKITCVILAVVWTVVLPLLLSTVLPLVRQSMDRPVNDKLSREEYVAEAETVSPLEFYRSAEGYRREIVTLSLVVERVFVGFDEESGVEDTYYTCRAPEGGSYSILVRDCQLGGGTNLMVGDEITVWGEGAGNRTVYDSVDYEYGLSAPCLNGAYLTVTE